MNSRDQYKIIGLFKISNSMKQPCSSVCLKIVKKCIKLDNGVPWLNKVESQIL